MSLRKKKKKSERKKGSERFKVLPLYFCVQFPQTERSHCFPAAVWYALLELWSALVGAAERDLLSWETSTVTAAHNSTGADEKAKHKGERRHLDWMFHL